MEALIFATAARARSAFASDSTPISPAICAYSTSRPTRTARPFQKTAWAALHTIPPGTTLSYGALARIVVPCHRVIGSNGTLIWGTAMEFTSGTVSPSRRDDADGAR